MRRVRHPPWEAGMTGWEALGWILPSEPGRPYVMDRDHIHRIHVPSKDSDRPAIHAIPSPAALA